MGAMVNELVQSFYPADSHGFNAPDCGSWGLKYLLRGKLVFYFATGFVEYGE